MTHRASFSFPDRRNEGLVRLRYCVCLARHDLSVGENPTRLTLAPAGSTGGGPGGNKWAEALPEAAS